MRALARLPVAGAAVLLIDWGPTTTTTTTFPLRPRRFTLRNGALGQYECFGRTYLLRFRAAGHDLQANVALGRSASQATRRKALSIIDSIGSVTT